MENTPDISLSSRPWLCLRLLLPFATPRVGLKLLGIGVSDFNAVAFQIIPACACFLKCVASSVSVGGVFLLQTSLHSCPRAQTAVPAEACDIVSVVEAHLRYLSSGWDFSLFESFFAHLFSSNRVYQNRANFYT